MDITEFPFFARLVRQQASVSQQKKVGRVGEGGTGSAPRERARRVSLPVPYQPACGRSRLRSHRQMQQQARTRRSPSHTGVVRSENLPSSSVLEQAVVLHGWDEAVRTAGLYRVLQYADRGQGARTGERYCVPCLSGWLAVLPCLASKFFDVVQ